MPTGAGKTLTAAAMVANAIAKGRRVCFVVPALELIDQTVEAFMAEGIHDVGVIQGNHPLTRPRAAVQVASAQTLARRFYPDVDLVIVDECHVRHRAVTEWMDERPDLPFVGLSATPWTRALGQTWDDLIQPVTMAQLVELEFLTPIRAFAPSQPDLSGVRTQGVDYREGELSTAMQPLTADVVQTWLEKGRGLPTLCFAVDRAHARHLADRFQAEGVQTAYVDGETPRDERKAIARQFRNGDVQVACSVGVLTTGVDWDVRCVSMARPTKSINLWHQMIGRGLRPAPGKQHCLLLDHSDNALRLGLPVDFHRTHLCDGTERSVADRKADDDAAPKPRKCPNCASLVPPKVKLCGVCGFVPQTRPEGVETMDGELVELKARKRQPSPEEKARFYGELLGYARANGKTTSWALANFRDKHGHWPHGKNSIRPVEPSEATMGWLHSKRIAWAKRKAVA